MHCDELVVLLAKVRSHLTTSASAPTDDLGDTLRMLGTYDSDVQGIRSGDRDALERMNIAFLPTAWINERALKCGWTREYLRIAERFDELYRALGGKRGG